MPDSPTIAIVSPFWISMDVESKISILGMQALSPNKFHDDGWYKSATSMLDEAAKPKAECEIKVIEGIKKLVSATK